MVTIAFITWPSAVVLYAVVGVILSLIVGTAVRLIGLRHAAADFRAKRLGSLRSWWAIILLFSAALMFGTPGGVVFFTLVSWLAISEFMKLTQAPYREFGLARLALLLVPLNYLWILLGWREVFVVFIPVAALLLIAVRMTIRERAEGFLLTAASLNWGLMMTVYFVSHAALLLTLSEGTNPVAGSVGWLLYLLVLTGLSDITQALIGRRWGKRPVAPVLSPHKTQLGLFGGVAVTVVLAVALAPLLTPLADTPLPPWLGGATVPMLPAVLTGLMVALAGYCGDITISGIKRDVQVKDSGTLLPGQGGILDRIDSLMFTAPLFYYFVVLLRGF